MWKTLVALSVASVFVDSSEAVALVFDAFGSTSPTLTVAISAGAIASRGMQDMFQASVFVPTPTDSLGGRIYSAKGFNITAKLLCWANVCTGDTDYQVTGSLNNTTTFLEANQGLCQHNFRETAPAKYILKCDNTQTVAASDNSWINAIEFNAEGLTMDALPDSPTDANWHLKQFLQADDLWAERNHWTWGVARGAGKVSIEVSNFGELLYGSLDMSYAAANAWHSQAFNKIVLSGNQIGPRLFGALSNTHFTATLLDLSSNKVNEARFQFNTIIAELNLKGNGTNSVANDATSDQFKFHHATGNAGNNEPAFSTGQSFASIGGASNGAGLVIASIDISFCGAQTLPPSVSFSNHDDLQTLTYIDFRGNNLKQGSDGSEMGGPCGKRDRLGSEYYKLGTNDNADKVTRNSIVVQGAGARDLYWHYCGAGELTDRQLLVLGPMGGVADSLSDLWRKAFNVEARFTQVRDLLGATEPEIDDDAQLLRLAATLCNDNNYGTNEHPKTIFHCDAPNAGVTTYSGVASKWDLRNFVGIQLDADGLSVASSVDDQFYKFGSTAGNKVMGLMLLANHYPSKLKSLEVKNFGKFLKDALDLASDVPTELLTLSLSGNQITSLAGSSFNKLEKLDLSNNQIETTPAALTSTELLTEINLSNNGVGTGDKTFEFASQLIYHATQALEKLDVSSSHMKKLIAPGFFGANAVLTELNFSGNAIPETLEGSAVNLDDACGKVAKEASEYFKTDAAINNAINGTTFQSELVLAYYKHYCLVTEQEAMNAEFLGKLTDVNTNGSASPGGGWRAAFGIPEKLKEYEAMVTADASVDTAMANKRLAHKLCEVKNFGSADTKNKQIYYCANESGTRWEMNDFNGIVLNAEGLAPIEAAKAATRARATSTHTEPLTFSATAAVSNKICLNAFVHKYPSKVSSFEASHFGDKLKDTVDLSVILTSEHINTLTLDHNQINGEFKGKTLKVQKLSVQGNKVTTLKITVENDLLELNLRGNGVEKVVEDNTATPKVAAAEAQPLVFDVQGTIKFTRIHTLDISECNLKQLPPSTLFLNAANLTDIQMDGNVPIGKDDSCTPARVKDDTAKPKITAKLKGWLNGMKIDEAYPSENPLVATEQIWSEYLEQCYSSGGADNDDKDGGSSAVVIGAVCGSIGVLAIVAGLIAYFKKRK